MKVVILAGGLGTRISEETIQKPKPMIEIGGMPILWHIMKIYSFYGFSEFIICCGYKGYLIKEYFANYYIHNSDISFDFKNNNFTIHKDKSEDWKVTCIDTGLETMTGGRLKRIKDYIGNDEFFMMTYGDGVADINIKKLTDFHFKEGKLSTVTAIYPPARFGAIEISNNLVSQFKEKPKGDGSLMNGGYFVLSNKVFDYIEDDNTLWEKMPMEKLVKQNEMSCYVHKGYWQCMDTLRDKISLEDKWNSGSAPWKIWI